MALSTQQIKSAFNEIVRQLESEGALSFTKQEIKQAIIDAEAWAENTVTKTAFNTALTAGNFKSNATADQKRLVLIWALWAIIKG